MSEYSDLGFHWDILWASVNDKLCDTLGCQHLVHLSLPEYLRAQTIADAARALGNARLALLTDEQEELDHV